MDESVIEVTSPVPIPIDFIDLTKDSPIESLRLSRKRRVEDPSSSHSVVDRPDQNCRRALSPILLGNTSNTKRKYGKKKKETSNSQNEVSTLDISNQEENKTYSIETDNGELRVLSCPVCLKLLSTHLKPISTFCGHIFCTECLSNAIKKYRKCPICNTSVTLKSCHRIYL
ncbi:hypothetical protein PUN28_014430 [Cardiocondyla obscurior]